jgi:hypothetical protein
MLEPQTRALLTEQLRPPEGYQLDFVVGTTFSLDLMALLITPLSFALFDWEDENGQPTADIPAIMQALRAYSDRMAIFCQAGRIAVPRKDQPLFLHLEQSVFQAQAPRPGGLFHPKVWLMRFVAEGEPTRYRFLCMSRNLTFDQTWDVCFRSEGELFPSRRSVAMNAPLAEFIAELPALVEAGVPDSVRTKIDQMQDEVRRVEFELPQQASELSFVPLGLKGKPSWPFDGDIRRMLVVSPFIGEGALRRLSNLGKGHVLVSRIESLQSIGAQALDGFTRTAVLSDAADLDAVSASEETDRWLKGLHAKIYVADMKSGARVWVGSANATDAAFASNVEFLVKLDGWKTNLGVGALLDTGKPAVPTFGSLLVDVDVEEPLPNGTEGREVEAQLESARLALSRLALRADVQPAAGDRFAVHLTANQPVALIPDMSARCWPIRVGEGSAVAIRGKVDASYDLELIELTAFFAFELSAEGGRVPPVRFVLNAELAGAPEGRADAVLRDVLKDRSGVMRYLLLLLANGNAQETGGLEPSGDANGLVGTMDLRQSGLPLFESLLRALVRDPKKIDELQTVIHDLTKTPEGTTLLPDGLMEIWKPILEARGTMPR